MYEDLRECLNLFKSWFCTIFSATAVVLVCLFVIRSALVLSLNNSDERITAFWLAIVDILKTGYGPSFMIGALSTFLIIKIIDSTK